MTHLPRMSVAPLLLASGACTGPESPGNKSKWSVLQGVEYEHRSKSARAPLVVTVSGHLIAGLPRADCAGLVWVLLSPRHSPLYKQMPEGDFTLTSKQLAELQVSNVTVLAQLRAHVRE